MKPLAIYTLHELQLFPSTPGEQSVFGLLNRATTFQGRDKLQTLLSLPLASVEQIEQRHQLLQFVSGNLTQLTIKIPQGYLTAAQIHLTSNFAWTSTQSQLKRFRQAQWLRWFRPYDYAQIQSGTTSVQLVLRIIEQRTRWWRNQDQLPNELGQLARQLRSFFAQVQHVTDQSLNRSTLLHVDYLLRFQYADQLQEVLEVVFQLDAYCAIAHFLETANWTYPQFVQEPGPIFNATDLHHPLLDQNRAVRNDFEFAHPHKLTLLTGGNMSGKTTFLKTCGLAIYLAHIGLPVPAQSLTLSFFDCLLTSIHLSDSLEQGYSHFYTELIRIKEVAETISLGQRVFLIADELFRGTNPTDAQLCAYQVIDSFLQQSGSLFMISSHLPQLGAFYQGNAQIQFNCFRTRVIDSKLVFSYRLETGSDVEQTGLLLLKQTGVLASLKQSF